MGHKIAFWLGLVTILSLDLNFSELRRPMALAKHWLDEKFAKRIRQKFNLFTNLHFETTCLIRNSESEEKFCKILNFKFGISFDFQISAFDEDSSLKTS